MKRVHSVEAIAPPSSVPKGGTDPRRHDLDALRAAAMVLGIVYHAALSFGVGPGWMVQDVRQSGAFYVFQAWVHGFRMPLFFVVSGFFTAMLWRKRGLKALLWNRFLRIFVPCIAGLFVIAPAVMWLSDNAVRSAVHPSAPPPESTEPTNLWSAVLAGDAGVAARLLSTGADPNAQQPGIGATPLTLAALLNRTNLASELLSHGGAPNARNADGGTPLHAAAFLGRSAIVELLLRSGANPQAKNNVGQTPVEVAGIDWDTTQVIARTLSIHVEREAVEKGRAEILQMLPTRTSSPATPETLGATWSGIWRVLRHQNVFILVWFLWFLCWMIACFAVFALTAGRWGWTVPQAWLTRAPRNLLFLVPVTALPQWFMSWGLGEFGPDTCMTIIPAPHVLAYYALFFAFGIFYFDSKDPRGLLGRRWRLSLPCAVLLIFPLALEFSTGFFGWRDRLLPARWHHGTAVVLEAVFAWMTTFGFMGFFRSLLTRENKAIRYLSDSAYWLYLSHLPLVILAQTWVRYWQWPALAKCFLITTSVTVFLLLIYQVGVRHTWLGWLLNGTRRRGETPRRQPPSPSGIAT